MTTTRTTETPKPRTSRTEASTCIGVGVDASVESSVALAWALDRSRRTGDALRLVTVVEEEAGSMGADYARTVTREASERIASVAQTARAEAPETTIDLEVVHGPVSWALSRAVGPADLLVVGTPVGHPGGDRVLGSRSVQIAAAARCSVVVVPPRLGDHRSGVVVGVETVTDIETLIEAGRREAALLGEPLLLVHCSPHRGSSADRVLAAIERAVARTADDATAIAVRGVVGDPVEKLVELAGDASLLVLGRSRSPELNPLGTTCHRVLSHAPSVVFIAGIDAASERLVVSSDTSDLDVSD
ncbi:universal stress protein [Labedella endophytica]|nr:universal stress protein [Labedella endophytica]